MKRTISLVLLILVIFSVAVFAVSCSSGEDRIDIEKNPHKDDNYTGNQNPDDLKNPSIGGDDPDNTWNEDGNAIGRPVTLPSN